jgi:hypothetical protein
MRTRWLAAVGVGVWTIAACSSSSGSNGASSDDDDDSCAPGDQDGITGGTDTVLLSVSDTGFGVGGPDSGSTQSNITVQNLASVSLTLTNIGTRPHDFVVQCLPTPNGRGCPTQSCFPTGANIPPLDPGTSATVTFTTPVTEGSYTFVSDVPGDSTLADGGATGLVGYFNLM